MLHRNLSRWAVMWVWEPMIKNHLLRLGLQFDELICVKKSSSLLYSGYFSIRDPDDDIKFGQLIVRFDIKGRVADRNILLWESDDKIVIQSIPKSTLILDKRAYFPWIDI